MVWYNYRRVPAVTWPSELIDEGRLGKIFHYRANFLQDWTISADLPQGGAGLWRSTSPWPGAAFRATCSPTARTALWLNGGIANLSAMTETFIKERKHQLTGKVEKVGIDDACAMLCRFANGSLGLFESTRYARGHKALYTFEINGEHASIKWDLHDLHRLNTSTTAIRHRSRWRSIHVTDSDHPYMSNGGCRACRSATKARSCISWPTSSTDWPGALRPSPTFAMPCKRSLCWTPFSRRPRNRSGSRCPLDDGG